MAGINNKIFTERTGQIKLLSIILGLVAIILTADHYFASVTDEKAFWWSIVVCFAISVILAVLSLFGIMEDENARKFDTLFHALAAVLLIIVSCFFIVQVDKTKSLASYERRAAAGAFGLIYGVVCAYLGWSILQ